MTAGRGSDRAIDHLDHESFDLAILDKEMYRMNGVELLAEIKKRSPSTKVIMVSGNLTDEIRDECIKLGATDYFSKPVQLPELKAVVRQLAAGVMQQGVRDKRD